MFWRDDIDPAREPLRVLIKRGDIVDDARDGRIVPYKIYYPVEHDLDTLPVIIWSHGLGGGREAAAYLSRFVAGHGYIVVHPQHAGTDTGLWEGKSGHPWDVIRNTHIPRSATLDRYYDIPFVVNQLPQLFAAIPEIGNYAAMDNLAIAGHSFGALTTQVMGGMLFPDENDTLISIQENRFKAAILYSFVPMDHLTDAAPENVYGALHLPTFFMTGTADNSPLTGLDYTHRLPVYEHAGTDDKMMLVLKDGDHMVFTGSRGKLDSYPKRKQHEDIIKIASLAYWDAHLKDDEEARRWLTAGGFAAYLGDEASVTIG